MPQWEYNVTNHVINELTQCVEHPEQKKVYSCNEDGSCMVNDVCKIGTSSLKTVLNKYGNEGWELIATDYHHGELLCIWKRPQDKH